MTTQSKTNLKLSVFTIISRFSGYVRQFALAFALGGGALQNTYSSANETPNMVYELFIGGILGIILLPEFMYNQNKYEKDEADSKNSAIISLYLCILLLIVVLGILFAPIIFKIYSVLSPSGVKSDQQIVGTYLLRLFMPQVFFYGVAAMATSLLNSKKKFTLPAVAPIVNNVVLTLLYFYLYSLNSKPSLKLVNNTNYLTILGAGTTLAVFVMASIYLFSFKSIDYKFRFKNPFKSKIEKEFVQNSWWSFAYALTNFISLIFVIIFANRSSNGYTVYLMAWSFFQLPFAIFAASIITSTAPIIVENFAKNEIAKVQKIFTKSTSSLLLGMSFLTVFIGVNSFWLLRLAFDHGAVEYSRISKTPLVLIGFLIGAVAFSMYMFCIKIFILQKKTKQAFYINAIENSFNVVSAYFLVKSFGIFGLSLSFSLSYILGFGVIFFQLKKYGFVFQINFHKFSKVFVWIFSLLSSGLVIYFFQEYITNYFGYTLKSYCILIIFSIVCSIVILSLWTKFLSSSKTQKIFHPKSWWHTLMQD